jgi:hypothetical protein
MRTVVLGPPPVELEALFAHRRAIGADRYDEVWDGEYHMAPAPNAAHGDTNDQLCLLLYPAVKRLGLFSTDAVNVGDQGDYRVPDRAVHRHRPRGVWLPTVAIAIEIASPHDESWEKLAFYAAHHVDEVLIVDQQMRQVTWLGLSDDGYVPIERSMLGISAAELTGQIDWPPVDE